MANDSFGPRDPFAAPQAPPPQKSIGCFGKLMIGCGCFLAIVTVVGLIGGWYVANNWRNLFGSAATSFITPLINDSKLPDDQKKRLIDRITQVKDDWAAQKITDKQLGQIVDSLVKSPLLPAGSAYFVDEHYLQPSGLMAEEKAAGKRATQRLARGVIEKKINEAELAKVLEPVSEPNPNEPGKTKLKEHLTDDELREFIKRATEAADEADIPDEDFQLNVADEFDKAVNQALAGDGRPAEAK